jgi:hypothetical protein
MRPVYEWGVLTRCSTTDVQLSARINGAMDALASTAGPAATADALNSHRAGKGIQVSNDDAPGSLWRRSSVAGRWPLRVQGGSERSKSTGVEARRHSNFWTRSSARERCALSCPTRRLRTLTVVPRVGLPCREVRRLYGSMRGTCCPISRYFCRDAAALLRLSHSHTPLCAVNQARIHGADGKTDRRGLLCPSGHLTECHRAGDQQRYAPNDAHSHKLHVLLSACVVAMLRLRHLRATRDATLR